METVRAGRQGRWRRRALLALCLGAATAPGHALADEALRAVYHCRPQAAAPGSPNPSLPGRRRAMSVTALFFRAEPPAVVLLQGEDLQGVAATRLRLRRSGSGARYAEAGQEFWVKGGQAWWRRDADGIDNCNVKGGP